MTHCNPAHLPFSSGRRRAVQADFSGGVLTPDAGALLLREADRRLGLIGALDRAIPDPRQPALITHPQRALLAQRVFAIACGCEDLNDHQRLRDDPLWQTATDHPGPDRSPELASPPTLCRLENRIRRDTLVRLAAVLVEQFIAAQPAPPEELVLDFDATDDPVHGRQENRFFHGYYDGYCFLPLYVTCGDHLLVAYLRPANIDASEHSRAVLKLLVGRLRRAWPRVRIGVRADSGFCRWRLMRWCDRHGVDYLLGLARNAVLQRRASAWQGQAERAYRADGQAHRVFGEFRYAADSWDRPRRVLAKAEHLPGDKANPRFVVTSLSGGPQALYEGRYCPRGEMENRLKEQQLGLFADRTSCHRFLANQFRVPLAAAAYVPVAHIRRVGLAGTELERAEVGTIRLRLFKIGAWVRRSVRRVVVRLASSYPWPELFAGVVGRLVSAAGVAAGP
jgi:hypothetical protein